MLNGEEAREGFTFEEISDMSDYLFLDSRRYDIDFRGERN